MMLLVLHAPPPTLNVDEPQVFPEGETKRRSFGCRFISFRARQRLPPAARSSRLRSRRAGCAEAQAAACKDLVAKLIAKKGNLEE